jgi:hypothetical protein
MADWINDDPRWKALTPDRKAAAMALLEVGEDNPVDAIHVTGAMVNRAAKEKKDLGAHVGSRMYQPTFDARAKARFDEVLASPHMEIVSDWVRRRQSGEYGDPVNGATHFLMSPKDMLEQERKNPSLYKDWGPRGSNWTGYDPQANPDMYGYEVFADKSHRFLTPKEHGGTLAQDPERVGVDPRSMPNYGGAPGTGPTPQPEPGAETLATPGGAVSRALPTQERASARAPTAGLVGAAQAAAGQNPGWRPSEGSVFAGLQSLFGGASGASGAAPVDQQQAAAQQRAKGQELAKHALEKAAATAAAPSAPPVAHDFRPNYTSLANAFGTNDGYLTQNLFSLNDLFGAQRQG